MRCSASASGVSAMLSMYSAARCSAVGEARRGDSSAGVERRQPALDQPPHHRLEQPLLAA